MGWNAQLHRLFAKLHGAGLSIEDHPQDDAEEENDLASAYAEYAIVVARASAALQAHGKQSKEFHDADIAGMRLFHRVKSLQGVKNPRRK